MIFVGEFFPSLSILSEKPYAVSPQGSPLKGQEGGQSPSESPWLPCRSCLAPVAPTLWCSGQRPQGCITRVVLGRSDPRAQGAQVPRVPHRAHTAPSLGSPAFHGLQRCRPGCRTLGVHTAPSLGSPAFHGLQRCRPGCRTHRAHTAPSLGSPAFSTGFSAVGLAAELSEPTGYGPGAVILLGDIAQTPKLL